MSIFNLLSWMSPVVRFQLLPSKDLVSGVGYSWRLSDSDSYFYLQSNTTLICGWYMLGLKMTSTSSRLATKFRVREVGHLCEDTIFSFDIKNEKLSKQIIYLKKPLKSLRFYPADQECEFTVDVLSLTKLTASRARELMLKKLKSRQFNSDLSYLGSSDLLSEYRRLFESRQDTITYQQWIDTCEKPLQCAQNSQLVHQSPTNSPIISLILATFNSPPAFLRDCIESVISQQYPNWQLCIADDASSDPRVIEILTEYALRDYRIQFVVRPQNGHISAASNSALELASGDYVAFIDHDDVLASHALLVMANFVSQYPDAGLIYSDEDKIDELGNRSNPHFKPDWNRDLFYSHNYIGHFCMIKRELVNRVGGFRQGVEGSQDYDLFLRVIAHLGNKQIIHIPQILYHWRMIPGSTALSGHEKSYTHDAGLKALQNFFKPTDLDVTVDKHRLNNCYRVHWPLPKPLPLVSLIIPTRDGYELLKQCIESIRKKTTYANFEIIVINNQTQCQKTLDYFVELHRFEIARVIDFDQEFNFSKINNFGVEHSKGSIIGLLNNDIEVLNADWLAEMVSQVSRSDIGCVGAKLYYPDGRVQHGGVVLGISGVAGHSHKYFGRHHHGYHSRLSLVQNYSAVTGAALFVRKSVYTEVNGLEPELKVAFNDIDFCLKVREAGYRNLWTPFAEMIHHESVSRGFEDTPEKQQRFKNEIEFMIRKWGRLLAEDPCYNPNLTLTREDFSMREL